MNEPISEGGTPRESNKASSSITVSGFVDGVRTLQRRNKESVWDRGTSQQFLGEMHEPKPVSTEDQLRMEDDMFHMSEGETFSPIGLGLRESAKVEYGRKQPDGETKWVKLVAYGYSLKDADKFLTFLQQTPQDQVTGDFRTSMDVVLTDLYFDAEDVLVKAHRAREKPALELLKHGDEILAAFSPLGIRSHALQDIIDLVSWSKKGVGYEWTRAKRLGLFDPVGTNRALDPFIPFDKDDEVSDSFGKNELALLKFHWEDISKIFNELRSNPQAAEIISLLRDNAIRHLNYLREKPGADQQEVQQELDRLQLTFNEVDSPESES